MYSEDSLIAILNIRFYNVSMSAKSSIKIHTKRHGKADPVEEARILQKTIQRLRRKGLVHKGLYHFKTHEEADAWMMKEMVATRVSPKSKT